MNRETQQTTSHTPASSQARLIAVMSVLVLLLVMAAAARLYIGSSSLGWPDWSGEIGAQIWRARLFRLAVGVIVGVALSVSGVGLQTLLRNPLAEPYILGLSTGAAAGIMGQSLLAYYVQVHLGRSELWAVLGASLSMLVVFLASRRRGLIDPLGLLLTGVVLSTINGALIMLFNYMVGPGGIRDDLARWMMGYLNEGTGEATIASIAILTALGLAIFLAVGRAMDVATLSDTEAQALGVPLGRLRTVLFFVASVLAAGAVVLAGPVAFVGLICPHVARLLLGPAHRPLLVAAALIGASLILLADTLSALIHIWKGWGLMPIGIITAMVGGPVFLWMLHPQLGRGSD